MHFVSRIYIDCPMRFPKLKFHFQSGKKFIFHNFITIVGFQIFATSIPFTLRSYLNQVQANCGLYQRTRAELLIGRSEFPSRKLMTSPEVQNLRSYLKQLDSVKNITAGYIWTVIMTVSFQRFSDTVSHNLCHIMNLNLI